MFALLLYSLCRPAAHVTRFPCTFPTAGGHNTHYFKYRVPRQKDYSGALGSLMTMVVHLAALEHLSDTDPSTFRENPFVPNISTSTELSLAKARMSSATLVTLLCLVCSSQSRPRFRVLRSGASDKQPGSPVKTWDNRGLIFSRRMYSTNDGR